MATNDQADNAAPIVTSSPLPAAGRYLACLAFGDDLMVIASGDTTSAAYDRLEDSLVSEIFASVWEVERGVFVLDRGACDAG